MEAIKLLNDWSKWIVTLETGAIAGILAWLKPTSARPGYAAGHLRFGGGRLSQHISLPLQPFALRSRFTMLHNFFSRCLILRSNFRMPWSNPSTR